MLTYNEMMESLFNNYLKSTLVKYSSLISVTIKNGGIEFKNDSPTSLTELFQHIEKAINISYTNVPFFYCVDDDDDYDYYDDDDDDDDDDDGKDNCFSKNEKVDLFFNPEEDFESPLEKEDMDSDYTELFNKLLELAFLERLADRSIIDLRALATKNSVIKVAVRQAAKDISKCTEPFFLLILKNAPPLMRSLAPLLLTIAETEYEVCTIGLRQKADIDNPIVEENALIRLELISSCDQFNETNIRDITYYFKTIMRRVIEKMSKPSGTNLKINEYLRNSVLPFSVTVNENHDKQKYYQNLILTFRRNLFSHFDEDYKFPDTLYFNDEWVRFENYLNLQEFVKDNDDNLAYNISLMCFILWRSSNIGKSPFQCFNNAFGNRQYFVDIKQLNWVQRFEDMNQYEEDEHLPKTYYNTAIKELYNILNKVAAARLVLFEQLSTAIAQILTKYSIDWSTLNDLKDKLYDKCLLADNLINFEYNQFSRYSILDVLDYFEIIDMYRKSCKGHQDQQDH